MGELAATPICRPLGTHAPRSKDSRPPTGPDAAGDLLKGGVIEAGTVDEVLESLGIPAESRPETLDPERFVILAEALG